MLTIQNVDFKYKKKEPLFAGLDLSLNTGTIYGLLGKNGTGKSTLLKLLIGSVYPQVGQVQVNGHQSCKRKPSVLRNIYLLQEHFTLPKISVNDYVKANAGFYPKFDHSKFYELLSLFEVDSDVDLGSISFGQTKKVEIAFALSTHVDTLLMDEPTNGLDIPSKSQFRKAVLRGFRDDQVVIISTHQIRDLNQLIESVIILDAGKIIFNQPTSEIETRLQFSHSSTEQNTGEILYSEQMPFGYTNISCSHDQVPSEVELEVLFNAVLSHPDTLNQAFTQTNS